jgi:hypothetical protein
VSPEDGIQLATWRLLVTISGGCRCDACCQARFHAERQIEHGRLCLCFECESDRAWLTEPKLPNSCEGHPPWKERAS